MDKQTILKQAVQARKDEVLGYQINIDNYTLALAHIDKMPEAEQVELAEFKEMLTSLLKSEIVEQKKAKIMLAVIEQQLV
jgi:hypothetical protein